MATTERPAAGQRFRMSSLVLPSPSPRCPLRLLLLLLLALALLPLLTVPAPVAAFSLSPQPSPLTPPLRLHRAQRKATTTTTTISSKQRRRLGVTGSTALRAGNNDDDRLDRGFNLLELASGGLLPQGKIVFAAKESWKFAWKRMMAELAPQDRTGSYRRPSYGFDGRIGSAEFPDEPGRYQLYYGNPCPWCHRCVLAVKLLGFDEKSEIGLTRLVDDPVKATRGGWVFGGNADARDPIYGCSDLRGLYDRLRPGGYKGRCTAPLLVDKKTKKIVSNESSDIVRMLNTCKFGRAEEEEEVEGGRLNLYPDHLASRIDETNEWIYRLLNNGVYRCGFATSQSAYSAASDDVLEGWKRCEDILKETPYLCGGQFTESDLMLLPTALRFDGAYAPLFKAGGGPGACCLRADYPSVRAWLQRCWSTCEPAIQESIDIPDACGSYYRQLFPLNPGGIVPSPLPTPASLGLVPDE